MTADVWQNFLHQYSHKVSHLLVDISFVPLYGATTLSWSQAYGPICSNATSVTFISRETAQSEGRLSDWDAVLGVLVPSSSRALTSINVSNWTFLQISNLQGNYIPYKSPFVTTATFRVLWSHPEYTNFPALTNLVLHGTFMSRLDWENLSTGCPRLRHLELDLMHGRHNDDDVDDDDDADKRLIDFPSLWSFNLRKQSNEVHDTWDLVDMIFADCTMPSLDNFSLSNIRLSPTDLHDIFVYLGDFDQLEVIEIHVQAVFGTMLDIRDVLENVPWVDSLIRLRILNQSSWFEMHDKDWEALGSHMTEMKEIAIEQEPTRGECHHGTTCTMRSLLSMAKHCKDLERLVISLHVSSDFAFTGVPILYSLQSLTIQHITIEEGLQLAFATFLAAICPNLRFLSVRCLQLEGDGQQIVVSSAQLEEVFWANQGRPRGPLCAICSEDISAHVSFCEEDDVVRYGENPATYRRQQRPLDDHSSLTSISPPPVHPRAILHSLLGHLLSFTAFLCLSLFVDVRLYFRRMYRPLPSQAP
ncbi:hypothetical protein FRB93_006139 [Tulasnella sp. JGI-2019a]|nr:hypothetical protein FRB93_006139 [Tulasnella sp. JGI-2019a]